MQKRLLFCVALLTMHAMPDAQTLVKNMSSANGDVYTVYKKGNGYYIGGSFNYVGLYTGYSAFTKTNNDYPNMDFPQFNGQVYSLIPDGNNGWYAGGNFTTAGGLSKSYLAHIKSDNSVDPAFNANCNGAVRTLYKLGTRLYLGGSFTTVNGTTRLYAAAVNSGSGAIVNAFNPAPNSTVNTITAAFGLDTTVWLGGNFTTINSTNLLRPYLARVNALNGSFISGSVSADAAVNKLLARGDSLFVGGNFSHLGLKTDYLASIAEGSSSPSQSMPNANGQIRCIIPDGSGGWYVGGYFTQIGGVSKNYVAHVKSDKTVDANFTASCNYVVFAMVKDGTRLYLGGGFTSVNSTPRNYLAQVSASTGALIAWDPNADNQVNTLALKDSVIIAGGYFTLVGGHNAYKLAVIKKTDGSLVGGFPGYDNVVQKVSVHNDSVFTGGNYTHSAYYSPRSAKITTTNVKPDPRFPATNGIIYSVAQDASGNYYVGGSFTTIGGVTQPYLAKLNSSFQVVTAWAPQVNYIVRSVLLSGTTVYIGGQFTQTNAVARQYISALNTANPGSNKTWNSSLNSYVYTLVTDGTSIYAGGTFSQVNGVTTRNLLAKFNLTGTLDATWNPNAAGGGGSVEDLAISGTSILAGGSFTSIGGTTRNYLAKLNNTNGSASNWATANSYVYSIYVDGTTCYAGGYFYQLTATGGAASARNYIGAIVISNGNIAAFNPSPNSYVYAINKSGSNIYFGGQFTQVGGTVRNYIASTNTSGVLQSWDPSANSVVNTINTDASNNIILGGSFSGFQETTRTYASIIKYATQAIAVWAPVIDNAVYDITYNATKIFIGGVFHTVNGAARNGLTSFNLKGVLQNTDLGLTKGGTTNVVVYSLYATTSKIYAGGDFDKAGVNVRNHFVEADITAGAGTISATNANVDDVIYDVDVQGTAITYGGNFRFSNFAAKNYLAIIRIVSGSIAPWTPLPDSYVFDIAVNYNKIFVVGQFDNVAGASHTGAVAFSRISGNLTTWNPLLARAGQGYYADLNVVLADSNNVYLGGYFDHVGSTTRNNAAIVAASNAALQSWDPEPNYIVRAMALNGSNLFIGGDFTYCKGASRSYIAKIDSATGLVNTTWNPGSNGYVYAITGNGSNIYAGGSFSQFAGVTRTSLAAVSSTTGAAIAFDPVIQTSGGQGNVYTLAFDQASVLYVGGSFNTAKGSTRNNAAAFTIAGAGTLRPWNPNTNSSVYALTPTTTNIYIGGTFTTVGGTARNYLASVNNTTGAVTTFNPNMNSYVYGLSLGVNIIYAGGQFTTVAGGTSRSYLAAYDATTGALKSWNPVANNAVYGIAAQKDTVYVGGYFTTLNGIARNRLAGVRGGGGTVNLPFNPDVNNLVRNHFISEKTLLTGGSFATVGGGNRYNFAVYKLPGNTSKPIGNDAFAENALPGKLITGASAFAMYPNPAHSNTTLKFAKPASGNVTITVTNAAGNAVLQKTLHGDYLNYINLDLSRLKNGTYIITVTADNYNQTASLIIAN